MNNIDMLDYVGGVPFYILKPVLEKCSANDLYRLEDYNPHFLEDSDYLWKNHCNKDFKTSEREEMESWRELYWRKFDEREQKLKAIRQTISTAQIKKDPLRQTKLAYVDVAAKPPREVRRQQLKHGTNVNITGERFKRFMPNMDAVPIGKSMKTNNKAPMMTKTLNMIKKMRR